MNKAKSSDILSANVIRGRELGGACKGWGEYEYEHIRGGVLLAKRKFPNMMVLEGRRYLLAAGLLSAATNTAVTTGVDVVPTPDGTYIEKTGWYVKFIGVNVAPSDAHNHTTAAIGGANEFQLYGSPGPRPGWVGVLDATGAAASCTNTASKASITCTGSGTIYGAALVSLNTIASVAADDYTLSYSQFTAPIVVVNGDVVNVTIVVGLDAA